MNSPDRPRKPELVSIDGSFKAGREGDKPGIIFSAVPAHQRNGGPPDFVFGVFL